MTTTTGRVRATDCDSLVSLLDRAAATFGVNDALRLRDETGLVAAWSYAELRARSQIAARGLRGLGLEPGDRALIWGAPTPALAASLFGAMRAGLIVVPLDLRMAPDVVRKIATSSQASGLLTGEGIDPAQLGPAGIAELPRATVDDLVSGKPLAAERGAITVRREHVLEVIYTSGTTGDPKGAILTHGALLSWLEGIDSVLPPRAHRIVSLLPLSHIFGQLTELFYALSVGSRVTYVRTLKPRVLFETMRAERVTSLVLVPAALELFWNGLEREVERRGERARFQQARRLARHLPRAFRRAVFGRLHAQLGGSLDLIVCSAAALPPDLQRGWEDLGITVLQGYGATECGMVTCANERDHPVGAVGRPVPPNQMRLAPDGEIEVKGPGVFAGYWRNEAATREVLGVDGYYRTGDIGRFDAQGRLVLAGRKRSMIVLPDGLNVFPEDVERALRESGAREAVVCEERAGRLAAVLLDPDTRPDGELEAIVKRANASLAPHQRVHAWRRWREGDFPRTHTLKVKRALVEAWLRGAPVGVSV